MHIVRIKEFWIFLGPGENLEQARERLEDAGYIVLSIDLLDEAKGLYEVKVKVPWEKVI